MAENDSATTPEETPLTINVLANDKPGSGGDGDAQMDAEIDRSTVDLDPEKKGIQNTKSTDQGLYMVDNAGQVTFSPTLNFFGATSIQYAVDSKGRETSNNGTISLTVTNVNDVPVIVGQNPGQLTTPEGQPVTIKLGNLIVTDPDNNFPGDFMPTVFPGTNYTLSGNTLTPAEGFSGLLPVKVTVGDGAASSEAFTIDLLVMKVNAQPVITGQNPIPLTTTEDQSITIALANLLVTDSDNTYPTGFTLNVSGGSNYSVSGQTVIPALNFTGTLSVPVTVNDGETNSEAYHVQISVTAVNDPPVITGQTPNPMTTGQNQALVIALSNLLVTDPDNVYSAGFTLAVLAGTNYTVSENTITPATGFTGLLSVGVTVNDQSVNSDPFPLQVSVTPNNPPVISGQTPLSADEDTSLTVTLENITVTDSDNSYPTGFTFRLLEGSNYTVDGDIITPAENFSGILVVPTVVNDGTSDSAPFDLQVTVNAVNDAPEITGQVSLSTGENQPITLDLSHLTVVDPDNNYSADFTLSVLSGENYSVSGNLITPAPGFSEILSVRVFVNDGTVNSNFFNVQITVNATNDPPVIAGQRALTMIEDNAIILFLEDLTVTDPDNVYPDDFTLTVQPGTNYTFSGFTVTPVENFTGELAVNVIVNDGVSNSVPFSLQISVTPVNDAPVITGQQILTTDEDVSKTIELTDLIVNDPDNPYPAGFILLVSSGTNYILAGNTVVPASNYSGALTIPVQVNDGLLNSNIFNLMLQVTPVNDVPVITGQVPLSTARDTPVTIQLSDLTVLDVDNAYPSGFSLSVSPSANYTVSGSTITPLVNFTGTLNVSLTVNDGISNSAPFTFQIQVGNASDPPVITGQTAVSTDEEKAIAIELSHLTVSDPDNVYPTGFTLLVSPGINYTVSGQTITPAVNFAGILTAPLRVNDGINNSATFNFQLQVNQINDPPVFAAIPNQKISENAAPGSIAITGISKGPFEETQQLTFVATSSNTSIINDPAIQYNGASATALLSYSVKPNMSGVVTITIVAIDNGSNTPPHQNAYSSSFQIEVLEINSAPTINAINNITLLEDAGQQHVALTGISAGPGETQTITLAVSSNKPEFFDLLDVVYVSPQTTGLLRFKLKTNIFGTVQVSVTVTDNGSGISPNVNTIIKTFSVVIQPVNDPPVFTSAPVTIAAINEMYEYVVQAVDPDNEPVTITALGKPSWATITPLSNGRAKLSGTPPASALGNVDVQLQAKDAATKVAQSFTIYVNARPSITSLTMATEEDNPVVFQTGFFSNGYTDLNENVLAGIQVTTLPAAGKLRLSDVEVKAGDTIPAATLSTLVYTPDENYFGFDSFGWKATDGYHFSLTAASVDISILSINDPPTIIFENDTLQYEVNGEPAFLASLFEISDPDDDTLTRAEIGFHTRNYLPEMDILEFQNTTHIRGDFNFQSGILQLTGTAPVAEYILAIRSIQYLHRNTPDPLLEPKAVFFTLDDGEDESEPKDKIIILQYTFIEFEIPSGFTPNGDHANDTWIIDRPGGLGEMDNAIINVYNKQGVLVFRAQGFDRSWDGTMNGELLPADTYFFTIDLPLRNKKTYKGIVTILR